MGREIPASLFTSESSYALMRSQLLDRKLTALADHVGRWEGVVRSCIHSAAAFGVASGAVVWRVHACAPWHRRWAQKCDMSGTEMRHDWSAPRMQGRGAPSAQPLP